MAGFPAATPPGSMQLGRGVGAPVVLSKLRVVMQPWWKVCEICPKDMWRTMDAVDKPEQQQSRFKRSTITVCALPAAAVLNSTCIITTT